MNAYNGFVKLLCMNKIFVAGTSVEITHRLLTKFMSYILAIDENKEWAYINNSVLYMFHVILLLGLPKKKHKNNSKCLKGFIIIFDPKLYHDNYIKI